MGRRRALAALAGMATGGLIVGGWELARSGWLHTTAANAAAQHPSRHLPPPGTKVWSFKATNPVISLAAAGGVVYAGTGTDTAFALDAATGKPVWQRATVTSQNGQLATAGGTVVIADGDNGGILGLNAKTGAQVWSVKTNGGVLGLAVVGQAVYAGIAVKIDTTGGVTALAAGTGGLLWTTQFSQNVDTNGGLAVAGGRVYATTSDGEIYAYDTASGNTLWRVPGRNVSFGGGTPVVAGGVVYVSSDFNSTGNENPVLYAVDAVTGHGRWHHPLGASHFPANLDIVGKLLFVGMTRVTGSTSPSAGDISALDAATGQQVWKIPVPGGVFPVTAGPGNVVYTGSNNGVLDAWQAGTGRHLWSYTAGDAVTTNIVLDGGIAYFGSKDNHVYAVAASP